MRARWRVAAARGNCGLRVRPGEWTCYACSAFVRCQTDGPHAVERRRERSSSVALRTVEPSSTRSSLPESRGGRAARSAKPAQHSEATSTKYARGAYLAFSKQTSLPTVPPLGDACALSSPGSYRLPPTFPSIRPSARVDSRRARTAVRSAQSTSAAS